MLKDATRRHFDVLMAWSVDRLGRSLQDLVVTLADLQSAGIDLYLRQQAIDTTSPSGRALFQMLGVFAEFERAMIRERVQAGIDRARSAGTRLGRPKLGAQLAEAIRTSLANGVSIRRAAQTAWRRGWDRAAAEGCKHARLRWVGRKTPDAVNQLRCRKTGTDSRGAARSASWD